MSHSDRNDRSRRLIILRALSAEHDGRLNEADLEHELDRYAHRVNREQIHALLRWLRDAGAVRIESPHEAYMIAEITPIGENHINRRGDPIEGIDLPSRI